MHRIHKSFERNPFSCILRPPLHKLATFGLPDVQIWDSFLFVLDLSLEDVLESFTFHLISVHSKESVKAAFVVAMVIVDG